MSSFTVALSEVPDGGAKIVEVRPGLKIALFRVDNRVAAINNRCPHAGASLGEGVFDGATIVCPVHEYRFNVWNGAGYKTLKTFATQVIDGQIYIAIPD